jgi:alkanesulfonate monooxygenase SsuD/methylene tetrahydromethanopterin reductase-like flavin-dependent oxidoreductase (luciferase family)
LNKKDDDNKIKFGCYIYQQGLEYHDVQCIAIECERLGFDSVWLKDNFSSSWLDAYFSYQQKEEVTSDDSLLECWTTLSSLATLTKKIRLGAILVNLHRSPSITAKMLSTLDVISNGRIEFGLSAGWYAKEIQSYGLVFPPKESTRIEMLEESIKIIKKMLTEHEGSSFNGKYYSITKAECKPKPIQKPHPPIWIGGGGKKTLELVARYADGWNYGFSTYDEYFDKLAKLKNYCKSVNRNYKDIVKAWHAAMLLIEEVNTIEGKSKNKINYNTIINTLWKKNSDLVIVGTPEKIIKEIDRYTNIGVRYFTIHFPDLPNIRSLQLFAKYVITHFRN